MARRQEKPEPQHADGAPEWMVTFSDCMTLLLTFFVLLLSFSSFDEKVYHRLKVIYSKSFPMITATERGNRDAVRKERQMIQAVPDLDKGSEKPTSKNADKDALLKEKATVDLDAGRVILIPSKRIFWGKGEIVTPAGREALSLLASFLAKVTNRVVISEHGSTNEPNDGDYGLPRAWAVSEHLVKVHGLDRAQFSISAASTLPPKGLSGDEPDFSSQYDRTVEIVLLDRSIHD